jgi:teichuronic acid biosynthesis glycosyltransferase TuaG
MALPNANGITEGTMKRMQTQAYATEARNASQPPAEIDLVSIITPLYNAERTIAETIASVQQQSWTTWEMLIVDDCSTDRSAALVQAMAQADPRIRYSCLAVNSGAAAARNEGLRLAAGRFIAFIDSDDLWLPEKLTQQIAFMQTNQAAFSFTEYSMFNDSGTVLKDRVASPRRIDFFGLVSGQAIMCSSVIIDRSMTGPFQMPPIRSGQDYATWAQLLREKIPYAWNTGEVLARYRKQDQSLSANKLKAFKRTWHINRSLLGLNWFYATFCIMIYGVRWIHKHYI